MKAAKWMKGISFSFFALALAACGTGDDPTGGSADPDEENGEEQSEEEASVSEYDLTFTMYVEEDGDTLRTIMTIENETDEEIRLDFASSQEYDVVIEEDGSTVYQYSEGQMFTQALVSETIEPGGEYVIEDVWEAGEDLSGRTLEVEAMLNIFSIDNEEIDNSVFTLNKMVDL
ncbi:BsuPI-related putative proteinase inhibitor [Alteribacter lacisalsi]|nr:BsuPI-related putative proteinase inhibitor [Alteribacter lacisalsi]